MKKFYYLIFILIIIILSLIQVAIKYSLKFSSWKLLFIIKNKSIPNYVVEGDNSILVGKTSSINGNDFDIYVKDNGKYRADINWNFDIIVNDIINKDDINLIKYYQKRVDDYYLNIIYPKEFGEFSDYRNSKFICNEYKLGKKTRNYCIVYIKNYKEKYEFYLGERDYEVDLVK